MQFSVQTECLEAGAAARLYVCTDACPCTEHAADATVALLCGELSDDERFASARVPAAEGFCDVAVLRLKDGTRAAMEKAAKEAAAWAQKQPQVAVCLDALCEREAPLAAGVLALAFGEAAYRFDHFKSEAKPAKLTAVVFRHSRHADAVESALRQTEALLYGINLCKDLGNTAPNVCTPYYLAEQAKKEAEQAGAQVNILGRDYIEANMGAFWSVAKGSVQQPQLIELGWFGAADREAAPIVLVGKGITFDTGGISLKPGEAMDEMKYDMCGAASVIGVFTAAARAKLPINLIAVVPTCENMPDAGASKPGDIVTAMNGTTIEILNTDAEGRLILCDALTYAARFKPRVVIDVATLTGACIIALGHAASGLLANNQELADTLLAAARESNDKAWQLPLFDEYKEQLKSNFADLQNIGGRPAGTITAAAFLAHFAQDYAWAHLDIAGTAWKSGKDKGATGRPVPLLWQYLCEEAGI
ncbi:leucyl aminopeptidase [Neisseria shayeganii]|uniref:Probable cytosol aminopeptidase n=1 Tax=Neisseria shayeganii 871 TaxID=1032488 RepID=G4CHQ0_9NEIS|nr:leucyl aminopeptidase [Neisseria shayeganii]EGY52629.1 leucyl aminopeptidase [Neisseria shayeganii 871]